MNWKHIQSCMKPSYTLSSATVNGQQILTDGHVMFLFNGEFACPEIAEKRREYEPMAKLWVKLQSIPCNPASIGKCMLAIDKHIRQIGEIFIAERYYRCFGSEFTYTTGKPKDAIAIHLNGKLIGAVMPMRVDLASECKTLPSDEEVFAPYADAENNFYLVTAERLKEMLESANNKLGTAEYQLDEAQAEVDECQTEVNSLRKRLKSMRVTA